MGQRAALAATLVAIFACAAVSGASAAVELDPSSGTGFVGKGDVQDAFAWNDANLQQNARFVGLFYVATEIYTVTCTGSAGTQIHLAQAGASGQLITQPRTNPQGRVNGFDLLGFMSFQAFDAPEVGDACGGFGPFAPGTATAVTLIHDDAALFVTAPNLGAPVIWVWP